MPLIDPHSTQRGTPVWQLAKLYPPQGSWSEADYLALDAGRLVEFDRGCVEVLELPSKEHQRVVQAVYRLLFAYLQAHSEEGEVFVAPLPIRLWDEKFREPDVVFVSSERGEYLGYPDGADLVVEVLSEDAASRRRDAEHKVGEYARAGIPEYWMIDLANRSVTVAELVGDQYQSSQFTTGQIAPSKRLPGFHINIDDLFPSE